MTLNEYFANPRKFKNCIIVISAKDEASNYIKNFEAASRLRLRLKLGFQASYVAVVDQSREFLYEKSAQDKIECSYKVGKRYIDIISAGFNCGKTASIKINEEEFSLNRTGLNVVIFKSKSLKLVDSFSCDSFGDEMLTVTK